MVGWPSARELAIVALFAKCRTIAGENRVRSGMFYEEEERMEPTVTELTTGPQAGLPMGLDPGREPETAVWQSEEE